MKNKVFSSNLGVRLNHILQLIAQKKYQYIWDVGTDHGLIPLTLAQDKNIKHIWASDTSFQAIKLLKTKTIQLKQISCLIANGLQAIKTPVNVVIIAGLGTKTILEILEKDNPYIENYIIQTNINPENIRKWIHKWNFALETESILHTKTYYYHTLLINKKKGKKIQTAKEILFGPLLLAKKDAIFRQFWQDNIKKEIFLKEKINHITRHAEKLKKIETIEKMLKTNNEN